MKNPIGILAFFILLSGCTTTATLGGQEHKTSAAGGYGGTVYEQRCPTGFVVSGIHGGAGLYVDRVGLICTSVDGVKTIALSPTSGAAVGEDKAGLPEQDRILCLARARVSDAFDAEDEDLVDDDESDEDEDWNEDDDVKALESEASLRAKACVRYAEAVAHRFGASEAQQWYQRALKRYQNALRNSAHPDRSRMERVSRPSSKVCRTQPSITPAIDWSRAVRKKKKFHYEISKKAINQQLADLTSLGMQARIIPRYREGRYEGFRLVGVRPNSFYQALGLLSGDIIHRINEQSINSTSKALELFEKFKKARAVRLEIERRGKPLTLTYDVR